MLKLFGNRGVRYVRATQVEGNRNFSFFDRPRAQKRTDIRFCGRTLLVCRRHVIRRWRIITSDLSRPGCLPTWKMSRETLQAGVDLATRHNEVARCQFEFAPNFTEANLSLWIRSQLIMETMRKMAHQHELRLLFHEKPLWDMNGSGKHINFCPGQ